MRDQLRRREFITLLSGVAAAWPLAARAQQAVGMRRIGVLMDLAENDPEGEARVAAFLQGLAQLGWTDGRNVRIDTRWTTGDADRIRRQAAELIALARTSSWPPGAQPCRIGFCVGRYRIGGELSQGYPGVFRTRHLFVKEHRSPARWENHQAGSRWRTGRTNRRR